MRTLRAVLAVVVVLALRASAAEPVTTVIVVRHAEKAAEPAADPPLTAEGIARAEVLSKLLSTMPVTAILSTDYVRTRSTAAPLAGV